MGRSEEVTETKLDNLGPLKEGRVGNQQIHTVYDIFYTYIYIEIEPTKDYNCCFGSEILDL
jgi:hypothetical protein